MTTSTRTEYVHQKLGEDCFGIAGYYTPQKEIRLEYEGRQVLYVIGRAVLEASCCGKGDWNYVLVPGYIISWHNRVNAAGLDVSIIDPILDWETRNRLTQIMRDKEGIDWISFWG